MKKSKFLWIMFTVLGEIGVVYALQKTALSQEITSSPEKIQSPNLDLNRVDTSVDKSIIFQEIVFISASGVYCSETRLLRDGRLIKSPTGGSLSSCNFKSLEGKLIRILSQLEVKLFQKFLVNHYFRNFDGRYKSYSQCKPPEYYNLVYKQTTLSGERGSVQFDDSTFSCPGNRLPSDLSAILTEWRSLVLFKE
jgi:hypothetical protein